MNKLRPMDAVATLYGSGQEDVSRAIVASLSDAIFGINELEPANKAKQILARISFRVLKLTTRSHTSSHADGAERTKYSNFILDRSGHPYAQALMGSSAKETENLVEGGDPMNCQYMMMSPQIRMNTVTWDRIFLDSMQGKDVRLRMLWETQATYAAARERLVDGRSIRIKAVAAGTGLSLILVYDRLIRDGFDPARITALITDRDPVNIDKANRLMDKLETTRNRSALSTDGGSITARPEDIFDHQERMGVAPFDIVTAIGILEYFHGHTYTTTESHLDIPASEEDTSALDLVKTLHDTLSEEGSLIVNSYRRNAATQLLELFGRRFDYRSRQDLAALMATADLRLVRLVGSGHVYDVEVYSKGS